MVYKTILLYECFYLSFIFKFFSKLCILLKLKLRKNLEKLNECTMKLN